MITVDALRNWGADVKDGLARCMNSEPFYLRMVGMVEADTNYENCGRALEAGDLKAAFEAAHALKGVLGNLALTPMFEPASELTEALRAQNGADYAAIYARLGSARESFLALFK